MFPLVLNGRNAHELKKDQEPQNSETKQSKEAGRERRTEQIPGETWTGPRVVGHVVLHLRT